MSWSVLQSAGAKQRRRQRSYELIAGATPEQIAAVLQERKREPPSEASVVTAGARNLNAELQARMARGETIKPAP